MIYAQQATQPITPIKYTGLTFNLRGLDSAEQKRMQELADRTALRMQERMETENDLQELYRIRKKQKRFTNQIILSPLETYAKMNGKHQ